MKFCKDCKWFIESGHKCNNPIVMRVSPVTGDLMPISCHIERGNYMGRCGEAGLLFEEALKAARAA